MAEHENSSSSSSSSSSSNSSSHPLLSHSSSSFCNKGALSTDLRLGLIPSASSFLHSSHNERIEMQNQNTESLFVKVYMEGIPIGRKLDLLTQDGYQCLITTLQQMFRTTIINPAICQIPSTTSNILTYEDREGDWMMVGDVPWEFFLTTVRKLKITRADNC